MSDNTNKKLYRQANKEAWNQVFDYHIDAKGKEWIDGFTNNKNYTTFNDFERSIYSRLDLKGKNIIQAPCNNGREVISLVNMGANYGLGIDIADKNIEFGNKLKGITKANVDFLCSDIYEIDEIYRNQFDFAFISVGSLTWMPNLKEYLKTIKSFLREDGELLIFEMHPICASFPYILGEGESLRLEDSYFDTRPFISNDSFDYYGHVEYDAKKTYEFQYTISDIIQTITDLGFLIKEFKEYPYDLAGGHAYLEKKKLIPLSYHLWLNL